MIWWWPHLRLLLLLICSSDMVRAARRCFFTMHAAAPRSCLFDMARIQRRTALAIEILSRC